MGSLIEELGRREAAARAEADRLRARIEELSGELARAEEQATRLAIARKEVTRVLEGPAAAGPLLPPDDPFAVSQSLFSALTAELAGPAAAGMTAFDLEQLVDGRGRELLL